MNLNRIALRTHLVLKEGLKLIAYKDTEGKWHIGFGHLLQQEQTDEELAVIGLTHDEYHLDSWEGFEITQEQADELLDIDIQDAIEELAPTFSETELEGLTTDRYIALVGMSFQMSGYKVKRFKGMCKAIKDEDWELAAAEMLWRDGTKKITPSAWHTQTPKRCEAAAYAIQHGEFKENQLSRENTDIEQKDAFVVVRDGLKEHQMEELLSIIPADKLLAEVRARMKKD